MIPEPYLGWYLTTLAFFFGACLGSFLNVCIHRIPRDESVVAPRSHCPSCGRLIPWFENIPLLSYVLLRGHCRGCGTRISPRYVLVELLTALLILAVWLAFGIDPRTPVYILIVAGLVLATFVDFEHMIIPDRVSIGGMLLGPVCSFLVPVLHHQETRLGGLTDSLIGLAVGFGSLWLVAQVGRMAFKKDAMGFGDVKLLGAIGAFLGWKSVLFTIMFSSLAGSVVGVSLILAKGRKWQSRIPFGPYLAVAALVWIFQGEHWMNLYLDFIAGK